MAVFVEDSICLMCFRRRPEIMVCKETSNLIAP